MPWFPEPCLWGLDPLFWTTAVLSVSDVRQRLEPAQGYGEIHFLNNHPIRTVEIQGIVVGVVIRQAHVLYAVDDGTAVISVMRWTNATEQSKDARTTETFDQEDRLRRALLNPHATEFELGDWVQVQGRVTEYREQRQIAANIMARLDDPNAETCHYARLAKLRLVYEQPFEMPSTLAPIRKEIERSLGYGVAPAVLVFDAVQDVAEARGAIAPTSAMNDATLWTEPRFTAALFQEIRLQRTVDFETLRDMLSLCECAVKVLTVQQRASDAANKRVKLDTGKGTSAPSPRRAGATATTTPNLTIDDHRVTSLFCRAISSLVRDGAIFLQDPSRDLYQVIAHDLNLGIDLFKVIKTACKRLIVAAGSDKPNAMSTTTAAATGLKEDYIVATIHQYANGRYRHVSKTDIVASLERLVESTLIYECGFHTYRVL